MDSEIILKKNENYWDKSADIDIDTIHYYIISDEAARTLAMKSGQVDIIVSPSVDMLSNLDANASTDNTERSTILAEAIKTATDECPYKNLFYRKQVTAVNTDKLDVDYNVMWQYNLLVKAFKVKTAE